MCPIREILGYLGLPALAPENNTTIPKQSPRRALKAGPGFFEACKLRKFPTRRWEKRPNIRSKTWQVWDVTVQKNCPRHSKIHTLFVACIYNFHNSISLLNIAELSVVINLLQYYTKALLETRHGNPRLNSTESPLCSMAPRSPCLLRKSKRGLCCHCMPLSNIVKGCTSRFLTYHDIKPAPSQLKPNKQQPGCAQSLWHSSQEWFRLSPNERYQLHLH